MASREPASEPISYARWGVDFFREAISEERVVESVDVIAGRHLDIGPVGVGPGGIARMRAWGLIGRASAERLPGETISFHVRVPVQLEFEVDLKLEKQRFEADLVVPLVLTAVALEGLRIFIAAAPPSGEDVEVDLQASGRRAALLQRVAGVEDVLRGFVADYVSEELGRPDVRRTRSIDVRRVIPDVWESIGPDAPTTA